MIGVPVNDCAKLPERLFMTVVRAAASRRVPEHRDGGNDSNATGHSESPIELNVYGIGKITRSSSTLMIGGQP